MPEYPINKRQDGKFEQRLDDQWLAEYWEDPTNALWRVDIFHQNVPEWVSEGYESLEDAARAALEYFNQV